MIDIRVENLRETQAFVAYVEGSIPGVVLQVMQAALSASVEWGLTGGISPLGIVAGARRAATPAPAKNRGALESVAGRTRTLQLTIGPQVSQAARPHHAPGLPFTQALQNTIERNAELPPLTRSTNPNRPFVARSRKGKVAIFRRKGRGRLPIEMLFVAERRFTPDHADRSDRRRRTEQLQLTFMSRVPEEVTRAVQAGIVLLIAVAVRAGGRAYVNAPPPDTYDLVRLPDPPVTSPAATSSAVGPSLGQRTGTFALRSRPPFWRRYLLTARELHQADL